jgi:hypothetical protein
MSKTLQASFNKITNAVEVAGTPVLNVTILSEGKENSEGAVVLDEYEAFYFAKTKPDLVQTLEKIIDALSQVSAALNKCASALTSLDTAGFLIAADAGVPGTPVATSDISEISSAQANIDTIKSDLTTLKGALR